MPNLGKQDHLVAALERHQQSRSLQISLDSLALQPTTRGQAMNLTEATPTLCRFLAGIVGDQFDSNLFSLL
jgi:hypothetical protein